VRLTDKVALITGGATFLGQAIALRFAKEGARIAVADINETAGQTTAQTAQGIFIPCDIADSTQARHAVEKSVTTYGGLDILVNCAAPIGGMHGVAELPETEWRAVLDVTLDGAFHCSKYAVPPMMNRGGGTIIHIPPWRVWPATPPM
jgi:NAD(P)-dependent dehydrogenase (short-subunit alcohol dehydrogenase family)